MRGVVGGGLSSKVAAPLIISCFCRKKFPFCFTQKKKKSPNQYATVLDLLTTGGGLACPGAGNRLGSDAAMHVTDASFVTPIFSHTSRRSSSVIAFAMAGTSRRKVRGLSEHAASWIPLRCDAREYGSPSSAMKDRTRLRFAWSSCASVMGGAPLPKKLETGAKKRLRTWEQASAASSSFEGFAVTYTKNQPPQSRSKPVMLKFAS
mmetsp:Transcript_19813/g.49242  ORF Transcript_19813/g.49242 Transcript_19813/m.49242 type:complete len:206 (+) Transcript_19813:631-1248(+)